MSSGLITTHTHAYKINESGVTINLCSSISPSIRVRMCIMNTLSTEQSFLCLTVHNVFIGCSLRDGDGDNIRFVYVGENARVRHLISITSCAQTGREPACTLIYIIIDYAYTRPSCCGTHSCRTSARRRRLLSARHMETSSSSSSAAASSYHCCVIIVRIVCHYACTIRTARERWTRYRGSIQRRRSPWTRTSTVPESNATRWGVRVDFSGLGPR